MDLANALNELNRRHFIATEGGKTRVWSVVYNDELERFDHVTSSFEDIRNRYSKYFFTSEEFGKAKQLGSSWLTWRGRRDYDKIVFAPNGNVPPNYYNLWRGFVVVQRPGDWSLFRNHLLNVVCREDAKRFEYLMGWIATLYQRPDLQAEVAIVLKGKKGTGKSIVGKALSRPLGQHAIHLHNQKYVTGNFNAHLRDAVFVIGDEAFWAGDKQGESVLKGLITDDRIIIEGKGRDAIAAKNRIHLLLISNDDWVVPASLEERRFFVLEVTNDKIQDHAYFGAIQQQLDNGGYEAMLYDLLRWDIAQFNIREVPETKELTEQKLHSLDPFKAWWYSKLNDGIILAHQESWDDPVQTGKVFDDYSREVGNSGARYRAMVTQFGIFLKRVCPTGWPKKYPETVERKEGEGDKAVTKTVRLWFYRFPPLDECRRAFEHLGRFSESIKWDDDFENDENPI